MSPAKPHWFRWTDLLFPGSLLPLTLAGLFWVRAVGVEAVVFQAGLVVVAIAAAVVLGCVLWRRRKLLQGFTYIRGPFYSVMVSRGSYVGALEPEMVIGQFHKAFERWQKVFGWLPVRDFADTSLFWVWLKPNLVGSCGHGDKMTLPGFPVARAHKIVVSYRRSNEPLAQTTFQHELGHVIQGGITGSWSVDAHHDREAQLLPR